MKKKILIFVIVSLIVNIFFCNYAFADDIWGINIAPVNTGNALNSADSIFQSIIDVMKIVSIGVAIIMLLTLAIKYMMASPEGKMASKKSAEIYILGAVLMFGASGILNIFENSSANIINGNSANEIASNIMFNIIEVLKIAGVGIAVIMIIVMAIKYMTAAPEGKAEFRKSITGYLIGAVVLFGVSGILQIIQNFAVNSFGN